MKRVQRLEDREATAIRIWCIVGITVCLAAAGCVPLGPKLSFPIAGRPDFRLHQNERGRVDAVSFHDDESATAHRIFYLAEYGDEDVPHLIVLLDSIPFHVMKERYDKGDFRWMSPPVKVIPPFPSLTEICYSKLLHVPPLAGMTDKYFDPAKNRLHDGFWERARGYREPWERRLAYNARYFEASLTYLDPRGWLPIEMGRMKRALDRSGKYVTIVYAVTASGMACKYGREGMERTLDEVKRLCLQLLYERRGAIKISIMADHGHNLTPSQSASPAVEAALKRAGFHVSESLKRDNDVVIELAALVNYVGLRTRNPEAAARACVRAKEVEFAMYQSGEAIIVQNADGMAAIERRGGAFGYRVIDADVLGYAPVLERLQSNDGFASDRTWFEATVDHRYPDACRRIWEAFGGLVVSTPDVMVTLKSGYHAGDAGLERFITMKSTHGSLDQINSATFMMTMRSGATTRPMRTAEVMRQLGVAWND